MGFMFWRLLGGFYCIRATRIISNNQRKFPFDVYSCVIEYNPDFRPGMKIFFPVMLESQEGTWLDFNVEGTYYVTEDEHVLSAFDEDKIAMKKKMTGKKLSILMQDVKK